MKKKTQNLLLMQNIFKNEKKNKEEKRKNPNPGSAFHSCHVCLNDLGRQNVGEFWALRRFLRSDFHLKGCIGRKIPRSNSEGEFVILTCQLSRLQADFEIRKRYPTEAQSNFTQSGPSLGGLLISWLFLWGMNVWVLDSLRGGLTILTGRTFESLGSQILSSAFLDNMYVCTPVFLICVQSTSGWSPRGMNKDLGWKCLIPVLSK